MEGALPYLCGSRLPFLIGNTCMKSASPFYRPYTDMRVREFFASSWRVYGAAWKKFLGFAAIFTGVILSKDVVLGDVGTMMSLAAGSVMTIVVFIMTMVTITIAADKISEGEEIGIGESYSRSFALLWRYLWTGFLLVLILVAGMILLIVPGIIWGIRYGFALYAVIVEGISGRRALSRSAALVEGRWRSILNRVVGTTFLSLLAIAIPMGLLTVLIGNVFGKLFAEAIQVFSQIISWELLTIFYVLLFKSLRSLERKANGTLSQEQDRQFMWARDLYLRYAPKEDDPSLRPPPQKP